jgi:predicted site-specific integrase-resolvase
LKIDSIEGNEEEIKKAIKADKVRRALIKEGIDTDDKQEPIPRQIQRAKRQFKTAST